MKLARTCLVLVVVATVMGACASRRPVTPVQAPRPAPRPAPEPLPELPAVQLERQPAAAPRQLYSLSLRDQNVREVLLALGKSTDLSFVIGPGVEGSVTADMKQATLEELLDAILGPLGLVHRREGNVIRVSRPQLETRVFAINYIASTRAGASALSATTGAAGQTGQLFAPQTAAAATPGLGGTGAATRSAGASTSSVSSSDNVNLWSELESSLRSFLSEGGKLVVSQTAGLVAVTDYPANIMQIARYLELVQGAVQRQVMIEAKILEVSLSTQFSAGVDWSLIPRQYQMNVPVLGTITGALPGGAAISQTLAPATGPVQVGLLATQLGLQAIIRALEQQGEVTVLSSPKISTLNNQKAIIKVATDDVFFTQVTQREPLTGVVTQTVTPNTITEGIVLDVTPQIGEDAITMNIRPSISERLGEARSPAGDVVPILAVRATDTVVRVHDGQTVVIGGLMQQRRTRNRSGVPGLQKLPGVGRAFRNRSDQGSKVELVILLTPTLVVGRRDTDLTPQELQLLREAEAVR